MAAAPENKSESADCNFLPLFSVTPQPSVVAQAAAETAANKQIEANCRGYAVGSSSSVNNPLLNTKGLARAGIQYLINIPTVAEHSEQAHKRLYNQSFW